MQHAPRPEQRTKSPLNSAPRPRSHLWIVTWKHNLPISDPLLTLSMDIMGRKILEDKVPLSFLKENVGLLLTGLQRVSFAEFLEPKPTKGACDS